LVVLYGQFMMHGQRNIKLCYIQWNVYCIFPRMPPFSENELNGTCDGRWTKL